MDILKSSIEINILINSILKSIQTLVNDKNAVVNFQNLPSIFSSNTLLFLVFKNLIENAIKYNESEQAIINISYHAENNRHHFLFEDNGIGIEAEFQEKVFKMFKRLNNRRLYEGSGLGLNIVKKLLDKIEGYICITHSEENVGTTFQVCFPIVKEVTKVSYHMTVPESN